MPRTSIESLGPLKQSWKPGSLSKDPWASKSLPIWFVLFQLIVVFAMLFCCLLGALFIFTQFLKPAGLAPGWLVVAAIFLFLFSIPMIVLLRCGQFLVDRNLLAIHQNGIRWAKRAILFEDIEDLSMGTQTFHEQHFPIWNSIRKTHWLHGDDIRMVEELERTSTLAFHLADGKVIQWRNFGQSFSPETISQFIAAYEQIEGSLAKTST